MEELLRTPHGKGRRSQKLSFYRKIMRNHFEIKDNSVTTFQATRFRIIACPTTDFPELTQVDTFISFVNENDQTPLNAAGGWILDEYDSRESGPHAWYNCPNTDNNQASVCAATGSYNQVNPQNRVSNQMAPPGFAPVQNNGQNRNYQNQGQGNNFNRGNNFHGNQGFQAQNNHAPNFQNQGFQNQPFQVPNNQVQQEFSNDFSSYKRTNDQIMRNMQNQINSLKGEVKNEIQNTMKTQQAVLMNQQNVFQTNLQNMLSGFFQNQASTSGTLPSNTIPNPKCEMKAITTRSGVAYEGPSIPTNPSPKKVVEREIEETTDKEQTNFQGSTAHIPPPVNPIPIPEPDVPKTLPKPNIPYPSRRNDQKFREKASYQKEKIFQMFQDLRFDISFADALFFMPRFAPTIRNLLMNKEKLLELAKIPLNENCSAMLLKKLPEYSWRIRQCAPEFLGFSKSSGGNPTPTSKPLTSEFILEEIEAYLKDDSISSEIDHADCDPEGNICLIEKLLINDPFQLPPMDLKQGEIIKAKPSIEEPPELELKDLPSHLEYAYLEENDKLPVIIAYKKDAEKSGIEVDRAKVDVFAKLPHPTTVKGVRSFLGHAGFYRALSRLSSIARPMNHLLRKETPFRVSKRLYVALKTLKTTYRSSILVIQEFGKTYLSNLCVMQIDFANCAVLGQRKDESYLSAYTYASKSMNPKLKFITLDGGERNACRCVLLLKNVLGKYLSYLKDSVYGSLGFKIPYE
ncbi:hypothetical protein Tco_0195666 [Tanacetum coccineum]